MTSLVVHGHFYQPPRENPWTGAVDRETSAHPFPNWNARILDECYARNRSVPLADTSGAVGSADNYRSLSFDFGPTLLDWLRKTDPDTVFALREADAASVRERGHGNALAHGYNHSILPLQSLRNRRTQIRWGLAHFRSVFGREAEGFWLPETAADDATLDALAEEGIRFTILSPGQLAAVRSWPEDSWRTEIRADDLGRAYRYRTRGNREIVVVFYDGSASGEMAFGQLLEDGGTLAERLRRGLAERDSHSPFFSVALDGESFGHHHRGGAEALAEAFRQLRSAGVSITNFAAALDAHPPSAEALLREPGSWSCVHGVERWRDHCGCTTGGDPGWDQTWRRPLFEALHDLEAALAGIFEREGGKVLRDPWAARDAYIDLLLQDSEELRRAFLADHGWAAASSGRIWSLLQMEQYALLMFTSCGWFFDDPVRLETRQILRYAARALEFCPGPGNKTLETHFLERLRPLRSNKEAGLDGEDLYRDVVKSSRSGEPGAMRYEDSPRE